MQEYTKKIITDIKNIKIQGASNIVFAVYDAFEFEIKKYNALDFRQYFDELIIEFWKTRPTEPALKSFLTAFSIELRNGAKKDSLLSFISDAKKNHKDAIKQIAENFASSIKSNIIVFTHCHSSIVQEAIIEAHKRGLIKYVVNTETRPLYQGRITSQKLADAGIEIYHIVDSGAYAKAKSIIEKENSKNILFLTGADVITNKGDLINKVGTSQISCALNSLDIKHYVLTIEAKIDVVDRKWNLDNIELRNSKEVWSVKNKHINVMNYSFDITPAKYITKMYTESGEGKTQSFVLKHKQNKEYEQMWAEIENKASQKVN